MTESGSGRAAEGRELRAGPPVWARAWVVTLALAAVVGVAVLVSPDLRRELELSTTRVDHPFLELSFADEVLARACLHTEHGDGVEVVLRSHLDAPEEIAWRATLTPRRDRRRDDPESRAKVEERLSGVFDTTPGRADRAVVRYLAPDAAYTLRVELDGRPEHLVLHCDGPAEAADGE